MQSVSLGDLADLLVTRSGGARHLVALAGPPGAGKTTLATRLEDRINAVAAGSAATLQMDGYHFDDRALVPRGMRPRKGAPETFDVGGFSHMLARLRADDEAEVAVSVAPSIFSGEYEHRVSASARTEVWPARVAQSIVRDTLT